jgi:hypothetical protein
LNPQLDAAPTHHGPQEVVVTLTIARTWAYGSSLDPFLAGVMSAHLIAERDWDALDAASARGALKPEHLVGVEAEFFQLNSMRAFSTSDHPFAELRLRAALALTPAEAEDLLTSQVSPAVLMVAPALFKDLERVARSRVAFQAQDHLLAALAPALVADALTGVPQGLPRYVARQVRDKTYWGRSFLTSLDLVTLVKTAPLLKRLDLLEEVISERVSAGALKCLPSAAALDALTHLTSLITNGAATSSLLPGSPLLTAWEDLAWVLRESSVPSERLALEVLELEVLEYEPYRPYDWPTRDLPTRGRVLDAAQRGEVFPLSVSLAVRTSDEDLRLACLASPLLAPADALELIKPGDDLSGLVALRERSWRLELIRLSALKRRVPVLSALVEVLEFSELIGAFSVDGQLHAREADLLRECVLLSSGPDDPRLREVIECTQVSTTEAKHVNEVLLPHLRSVLGDSVPGWEVVMTLVDTFTGTTSELVAASTELS